MPASLQADILAEVEGYSRTLRPESTEYWQRHRPRFVFFLNLVAGLSAEGSFERILDVGMGYQTALLGRLLPSCRVDCLGIAPDTRFLPSRDFTFHPADLNEIDRQPASPPGTRESYDLISFMEVVEHLIHPPDVVLAYLAQMLRPGGRILLTTPNAAWIRNRLALLAGRNPFEPLRADRTEMGHVRESTLAELVAAVSKAGLECVHRERRGLYAFRNRKDNLLSALVDRVAPSCARTLVIVARKPG